MMLRPDGIGRFEFIALARLRAHQLNRGCVPRIEGVHLRAVTAQLEVALGYIERLSAPSRVNTGFESDSDRGVENLRGGATPQHRSSSISE